LFLRRLLLQGALFVLSSWILFTGSAFAQTIARVDITADATVLSAGQRISAVARAKDADGVVIPNVPLTWTSRTPAIATVDSNGVITALFPGSVQITARTSGNVTGTLTFTVVPARVEIAGSGTMRLNQSVAIVARAFDINGNVIPGVTFTWTSDNIAVATVTAAGVVQATGLGQAVITATNSNYIGRMTVTVERPQDFTIQTVVTMDAAQGAESRIQSILSMSNLNARGDIAFVANLSGSTAGVVRDIRGQLAVLARTGDTAPLGGFYSSFGQPVINSRGDVAFVANVVNGTSPLLLFARGSELIVLLANGDAVDAGGTIGAITLAPDGLDDNGFAVATLTMNNPTHSGVFRISPETRLEALIRTFDETSIGSPTVFNAVSVSPSGRVAVLLTAGSRRGIYLVTPSSADPIAVDGAAVPGGGTFTTFQSVRASDSTVVFMATPQGASTSLYRHSAAGLEEIVHGGREASTGRTITLSTLMGTNESTAAVIATVSDIGFGVFSWNGRLNPAVLRNAVMSGGEILTRLDAGWISASGEISLLGVSDRHLSAIYRISPEGKTLRWGTGASLAFPANYYIIASPLLRPAASTVYFLAGVPTGLFKKSGNTVTPIAIPGMTGPRGDVITSVNTASSNANGDVVLVANSLDLTRTTNATSVYRYTSNALTEWVPFNQPVTVSGIGTSTIGTGGLGTIGFNSSGQAAFVGTIANRQSLLLAGTDIRVLLQTGTASPGGGTFSSFVNVQLTPAASAVFTANVTGGPSGLFNVTNGRVGAIALTGDFAGIGIPVVGGEFVYFTATRVGMNGLWVYANGGVQQAIGSGAALPTNTSLTNVLSYAAQEDGTIAFLANASFTGVFTRRPDGTMSTVALIAEPTPVSGRFGGFNAFAIANSAVLLNSTITLDRAGLFMAWPQGAQQSTPISSTDFSVPNRAGVSMRTDGQAPGVTTGYAIARVGSGSTSPSGLAIFSYRQGGILVSEATVPASPLLQAGRIYAESNGPTNTGIAIANPSVQNAVVSFYFTNALGENFGAGTTSIAPGGQLAKFLNESPFSGGSAISGSFTFASSVPVSVVALRGYVNERSEFLITTLPVGPIVQSSSDFIIFPHFADGQGWTTQVILANPTDDALSGTGQFYSTQGGSTFNYAIAPRGSYVFKTAGTGPAVRTGWVRVVPNSGTKTPSGLLVFSFKHDGITVAEAGVPASPVTFASRLYLEAAGNVSTGQIGAVQTGIAIANPNATAVNVTFDLTNLSGASAGMVGTASVPAQGQIALFANQITGLENLLVAQGVLRISAPLPVAVTGLRGRNNERGDFLITTVQPVNESAPPSTGDAYLPHFVDSGGYSTQFILYSGSANQSSSGTIRFFSQSGQPLALTFR
jgi:hypothetical protein